MRLLIITQKVDQDDSYFGFFHDWLRAFADICEQVTVITLERHRYTLPKNVTVHSLGKEKHSSRLARLYYFWKFTWRERNAYDAVFCHMSPLYVIAGYPIWKPLGKKIGLWYSHRQVDMKLRISVWLADVVFSTTQHAFRLKTKKVHFMGHAIDVDAFARPLDYPKPMEQTIIAVGRITPIKRLEVLIKAIGILAKRGVRIKGVLVGAPLMPSDHAYAAGLERLINEQGIADSVVFAGSIPFDRIREMYWQNSLSVNLAPTGGMDKVVLEAIAASTPVIVANTAFDPLLEGYEDRLIVTDKNPEDLANKIESLIVAPDREKIAAILTERVQTNYSYSGLMPKIVRLLETT